MDRKRLDELIQLYLDEGLDSERKHELEQELLSSPQSREFFWEKANVNSMLRQLGQESWGQAEGLTETSGMASARSNRSIYWQSWIVAAVCLIAIGSWAIFSRRRPDATKVAQQQTPDNTRLTETLPSPSNQEVEDSTHWVAIVRKSVEAEWGKGGQPLQVGEAMTARRIRLERGLVELQTSRGALLTLQGPAVLDLVDEMNVDCIAGRLRVDVPPSAIGFLVNTPHVDVVDLGTSFAVDVDSEQETEVHVITGKVELVSDSSKKPKRELLEGESVGVTDLAYREIDIRESLMPTASQVQSKARKAETRLREAWQRRRDVISNDPSCFVYFDFEDQSRQALSLTNKARSATESSDGTIVGCEWVEGRWPGKRALDFQSSFDRVLLQVPEEYQAITCLASIRLDSIGDAASPLLMPSRSLQDAFCWQLSPASTNGGFSRLRFGKRGNQDWGFTQQYFGTPRFRREQLRTWAQIAVVWDGKTNLCSQYVDGMMISRDKLSDSNKASLASIRTGSLEIGNAAINSLSPTNPLGHFVGRIDEWAMFNRALSDLEVMAFHDLKKISWANLTKDGDWNQPENWPARITPTMGDAVYVDRFGDDAAVYSNGVSPDLNEIRVGSLEGRRGELRITGGTLTATQYSNAHSRVGVAGGDGTVVQQEGTVEFNSLQIGLDETSKGRYRLEGGRLTLVRGVQPGGGSLEIGTKGGIGQFEVMGGSLVARIGVTLGRDHGMGTFTINGTQPKGISIGSRGTGNGFWVQHVGSTLRALIDEDGLTPILIQDGNVNTNPNRPNHVIFESGAILDVGFIGEPQNGSWDVMRWDGELTDYGLTWSPQVDTKVWAFQFVDTDLSGTPDTLRVTAKTN